MDIQQYVRIADAYRRAFACLFTEIIHDCIFHLVRNKLRMAKFFAEYYCIYCKCLVYVEIFLPRNCLYFIVNFVGILCRKVLDRFKNTDSSTEAEISLIHHTLIPCE